MEIRFLGSHAILREVYSSNQGAVMRKAFILCTLFIIILPLSLSAQDSADWYMGKEIREIQFEGLTNFSVNDLLGITEQYIGKTFTDELFMELQAKIYALDYFEEIIPNAVPGDEEYESVIIRFDVKEKPVVSEIRILGNQTLRKGEILDVVLLKNGDMVNKTKIRLDAESIQALYKEEGFPNVGVGTSVEENEEESTATVTFTITEGKQIKVKKIQFSGNSFASDGSLKGVMETKEQALFSSGIFQQTKLDSDLKKIETYYHDRGYIDAEVVEVVKEPYIDPNKPENEQEENLIVITLYVDEGEQWTFGGIDFTGNTLFSDETLLEQVRHEKGKVLNQSKLDADFMRVTDLYYNDGYIYNVINSEQIRNEQNNTISYEVTIVERGRAHIEDIIIKGNTKTKDYVILREIPLETGDIFSKQKVIEGLQNLYNTQYFSSIVPTTPQGSVDGLMDLVFNVEEGKTIDIQFGVTFTATAGNFPMMGFVKWTDKNLFGRGQELTIGTELSALKQSLNFGFKENWLFGQRWYGAINLSVAHELSSDIPQDTLSPVFSENDENAVPDPYTGAYVDADTGEPVNNPTEQQIEDGEVITDYAYAVRQGESIPDDYTMDYHTLDISLGLSTGYTWHTRVGRLGIGTGPSTTIKYLTYDEALYRPFDSTVRNNLNKFDFDNKWMLNLFWDTRDIIHNPQSGFYLGQKFIYTGGILFGNRHYIRSTTKGEVFFKLFDVPVNDWFSFKMILALHSGLTIMFDQLHPIDGQVFVVEPRDLLYTDGMTIARGWPRQYGGRVLWNNWLELRLPIAEQYVWWDFFFSTVGIWPEHSDFAGMTINDFLFTFGGGIRLTIPGLPIGLYLAKRFKWEDYNFEWQTGNLFNGGGTQGAGIDFVISFSYDLY